MMYFCDYTFRATKHPKFLQAAIDILMQAQYKAFRDASDVEILALQARKALEEVRSKGNTAHLTYYTTAEGKICVSIYPAESKDFSIGRAHFTPVRKVVTFSTVTGEWKELKSINLYNKEDGQ